jgi:hypothetical protein
LSRLDWRVELLTQIGTDDFGRLLRDHLLRNAVAQPTTAGTFAPGGGVGNGCPIPSVQAFVPGGEIVIDQNLCGPLTGDGSVRLDVHSADGSDNPFISFNDVPVS